ncbi:MAG: hypothetical protein J4G05_04665, partial [Chlorobi bacterium]|nr:hypothetical protein [Chlorobiota bacterium]
AVAGVPPRKGFIDKEKDKESGLGDFGVRKYDDEIGRFTSPDPLWEEFRAWSPYHYSSNNPLVYKDPHGTFQYPAGSDQETDYPRLTEYLRNRVDEILGNPVIMRALEEMGQLSKDDVRRALVWGEGPVINIVPLLGANGEFTPYTGSNELRIDWGIVNQLENSVGDDRDAALLLVASTILHEFVHWGDDQDGIDRPGEEGEEFEIRVYGIDIDNLSDAVEVLNEYYIRHVIDERYHTAPGLEF